MTRGIMVAGKESILGPVDGQERSGPAPRKRSTRADVAKLAGVSPSVVSAVLNGSGANNVRVSERTAARVWDVIRRLGYVPNVAARNLAQGRNRIIGVFTYEAIFPVSSVNFYHAFLEGIEEEARLAGCHLLLYTGSSTGGQRSIYADGVNALQLADGAILLGLDEDKDELSRLVGEGFPLVFVGRRDIEGGEVSYAAADYVTATAQMVGLLTGYGHRRLALVRHDWRREPMVDRETGFRLATEAPDAPVELARVIQLSESDDYHELVRTLRRQRVTAVLADDCDHAGRLCSAAAELGVEVPGDLSVCALSDFRRAEWAGLNLTTVRTPRREMGHEAVRLLSRLIADDGQGVQRSVLPCELEPGGTVGAR